MKRHPIYDFFEFCGRMVRKVDHGCREIISIQRDQSIHFPLFFSFLALGTMTGSTFYAIGVYKTGILTWVTVMVQLISLKIVWKNSKHILTDSSELRTFIAGALLPVAVIFSILFYLFQEYFGFNSLTNWEYQYLGGLDGYQFIDKHAVAYSISVPLLGFTSIIKELFPHSLGFIRLPGVLCLSTAIFLFFSLMVRQSGKIGLSFVLALALFSVDGLWTQFIMITEVPFVLVLVLVLLMLFIGFSVERHEKSLQNETVIASMVSLLSISTVFAVSVLAIGAFLRKVPGRGRLILSGKTLSTVVVFVLAIVCAFPFQEYLIFEAGGFFGFDGVWRSPGPLSKMKQVAIVLVAWWGALFFGLLSAQYLEKSDFLVRIKSTVVTLIAPLLGGVLFYLVFSLLGGDIPAETTTSVVLFVFFASPLVFLASRAKSFGLTSSLVAGGLFLAVSLTTAADNFADFKKISSINQAMLDFRADSRGGTFVYDLTSVGFDERVRLTYFGTELLGDPGGEKVRYRSFRPFPKTDHRQSLLWPTSNSLAGDILAKHTPIDVGFVFQGGHRNKTSPWVICDWFLSPDLKCKDYVGTTVVKARIPPGDLKAFLRVSLNIYELLFRNLKQDPENRMHLENLIFLNLLDGNKDRANDLMGLYKSLATGVDPEDTAIFEKAVEKLKKSMEEKEK